MRMGGFVATPYLGDPYISIGLLVQEVDGELVWQRAPGYDACNALPNLNGASGADIAAAVGRPAPWRPTSTRRASKWTRAIYDPDSAANHCCGRRASRWSPASTCARKGCAANRNRCSAGEVVCLSRHDLGVDSLLVGGTEVRCVRSRPDVRLVWPTLGPLPLGTLDC